jgi:hypothetical protein
MDAAGVIAHYVMDTSSSLSAGSDRPLTAETGGSNTYYLYGLGAIGEKTDAWSFSLPDGINTPRHIGAESPSSLREWIETGSASGQFGCQPPKISTS